MLPDIGSSNNASVPDLVGLFGELVTNWMFILVIFDRTLSNVVSALASPRFGGDVDRLDRGLQEGEERGV